MLYDDLVEVPTNAAPGSAVLRVELVSSRATGTTDIPVTLEPRPLLCTLCRHAWSLSLAMGLFAAVGVGCAFSRRRGTTLGIAATTLLSAITVWVGARQKQAVEDMDFCVVCASALAAMAATLAAVAWIRGRRLLLQRPAHGDERLQ